MAFFTKPVLFSEVTGVVMEDGRPLPNVEVNRLLVSDDKNHTERTFTDVNGKFAFRPIYRKRFRFFDLIPHETIITQKILFKYNGKEYKGYICIKDNYRNNGELNGKPISLICDINNEFIGNQAGNDSGFMGICRISNE